MLMMNLVSTTLLYPWRGSQIRLSQGCQQSSVSFCAFSYVLEVLHLTWKIHFFTNCFFLQNQFPNLTVASQNCFRYILKT